MLIDAHCHLDQSYFPEGPDAVLERARSVGVCAFVVIGVSGEPEVREVLQLAQRRPDVVVTAGVHPHDAATHADAWSKLEPILADDRVVAVGEVGLDFHYDHSPRAVQAEVFRRAVAVAREVKKPLVVHTRNAPEQTLEILESERAREVGGVIHCFSDDQKFAARALDLEFDVSFSGIVTFNSARAVHEVARWAPLERIMVETDSPYLAPVPVRGKKCEPAYVVHTARRVAELRGMPLEELARATTENACRRFGPKLAEAAGLTPPSGAGA